MKSEKLKKLKSMETSEILFNKMKEFEGCRLQAYQDAAGVWTIGYGHTRGVRRGDRITQWLADEYLRMDIAEAERQVLGLGLSLTQGQLDALVSFVFNVGIGRLQQSTLLRFIREGRPEHDIKRQFRQWVYAGGRTMPGLVKRREWEAIRFFSV
jgi:lysozyme